ncbi:MAG: helix-turn-helix domain-containing protein [Eubacteriales bacterium]
MELNLGASIKRLRAGKGVTQEELACYIGVSFQAVSKWETGTTTPDIALLPRLAVFFGVSIDELFSVDNADELERIDYMLDNEILTDEAFAYARRTLDAILKSDGENVGALKRYARLLLYKNGRDNLSAGRMLERAIELSPLDDELYWLYRQVRGGDSLSSRSGNEWFIRFCEPYVRRYPSNIKLITLLVEACIEVHLFDKARELVKQLEGTDKSYMIKLFEGDVILASDGTAASIAVWNSIQTQNTACLYELGERYSRIGEYDRAINCFEDAFLLAKPPRDLSSTYSLAFLFDKLGRYEEAINAWQRILDVMKSDWSTPDGEQTDWPIREMDKLKDKITLNSTSL